MSQSDAGFLNGDWIGNSRDDSNPIIDLIGHSLPVDKIRFIKRHLDMGIDPGRIFTLMVDVETQKGFFGERKFLTFEDLGIKGYNWSKYPYHNMNGGPYGRP